MNNKKIIVYGSEWCADCARSKALLDSIDCKYEYVDISQDELAVQKVLEINNGMKSIPTILFPDNTVLVEPSDTVLQEKNNELIKGGYLS